MAKPFLSAYDAVRAFVQAHDGRQPVGVTVPIEDKSAFYAEVSDYTGNAPQAHPKTNTPMVAGVPVVWTRGGEIRAIPRTTWWLRMPEARGWRTHRLVRIVPVKGGYIVDAVNTGDGQGTQTTLGPLMAAMDFEAAEKLALERVDEFVAAGCVVEGE